MKLIDTHTHLYLEQFDSDRAEVIRTAVQAGVENMLLPNIDSGSLEAMNRLALNFPENCYQMMGLHPTSVKDDYEKELELVESELQKGGYIAVGEIGMDLYWDKSFIVQQEDALRRQLRMAKERKLPVSIHTRDAFNEIHTVVKEEQTGKLNGIFHCFTGNEEEARKIIDLGFKMGIGGVVTFKNSNLGEVIRDIPLEHFVLETDAPFLAPTPFRGKRNQSSYLVKIAEAMAMIKGIEIEEVAEVTTKNARDVYKIPAND